MLTGGLWAIVEWLSLPVMAVLGGILVRRKLYRQFPFFFWFLVVTSIATVVRFAAKFGAPWTYFYAYWVSDLVVTVFNFLAVYELFVRRLFPRFHKIRFYRYLFAMAASAIILLGWLTALEAPDKRAAFLIEARILNFVLGAMLAFLVLLMTFMRREWTRYDFGIAFGFAVNAAAFIITSAMWVRTHYGPSSIDRLPVIAYDLSCFIWLYCFSSGDQPSWQSTASQLDPEMLHAARTWQTLLKAWLTLEKNKR